MSEVDITFKFPDLGLVLKKNRREIDQFIAAQMQFNRGMLFDQEGAYNGHKKWPDLVLRKGQILSHRGTLRKSIAPKSASGKPGTGGIVEFGNGIVTIGSNLIYAAMMNWGTTGLPGGVLVPKNAKALMIPLPGGKSASDTTKGLKKKGGGASTISKDVGGKKKNSKVLFVQSVKIPERRFDEWNDQDRQELSEAMVNKLVQVLSR